MNLVWFLTIGTFLTLILGEFGQYPFGSSTISISLTDIFLSLSLGLLLIWQVETKTVNKLPVVAKLLIVFFGVCLLSLLLSGNLKGGVYLLRFIVYSSSFYLGYSLIKSRVTSIEYFCICAGYIGVILSLLGFLQLIFFPDLQILYSFGYDPHKNRLFSTLLDPNLLGSILNLCLICVLYLYAKSKRSLTLVWIGIMGVAILLTFSRSAYLMLVVGLGIFFWFYAKKVLAFLGVLGLILVLTVGPVRERVWGALVIDKSASERIASWENGIVLIGERPVLGVGFNNLRDVQKSENLFKTDQSADVHSGSGLDSSILFVGATTGVIGILAFLAFWVYILKVAFGNLKKNNRLLSVCILSLAFGIVLNSQFINSLFFTPVVFIIYLLLGGYIATLENS